MIRATARSCALVILWGLVAVFCPACLRPVQPGPAADLNDIEEYNWTSSSNPVCAGDPSPVWRPRAACATSDPADGGSQYDDDEHGVRREGQINATQVVSEMEPALMKCHERHLGDAWGVVDLTLHVNCRGRVSWAHAAGHRLGGGIASCMFEVASTALFTGPSTGCKTVAVHVIY